MSSLAQLTTAVVSGTVKQVSLDPSLFQQTVRTYIICLLRPTGSGEIEMNPEMVPSLGKKRQENKEDRGEKRHSSEIQAFLEVAECTVKAKGEASEGLKWGWDQPGRLSQSKCHMRSDRCGTCKSEITVSVVSKSSDLAGVPASCRMK